MSDETHNKFTKLVSKFMAILGDEEALAANPSNNHLQLSSDEIYERMETMKDHLFSGEDLPEDFPPILNNIRTELETFVKEHIEDEELEIVFTDMMNEVFEEYRPRRVQTGGKRRRRRATRRRRLTRIARRRRTTRRR